MVPQNRHSILVRVYLGVMEIKVYVPAFRAAKVKSRFLRQFMAETAVAAEYTDCISAEL